MLQKHTECDDISDSGKLLKLCKEYYIKFCSSISRNWGTVGYEGCRIGWLHINFDCLGFFNVHPKPGRQVYLYATAIWMWPLWPRIKATTSVFSLTTSQPMSHCSRSKRTSMSSMFKTTRSVQKAFLWVSPEGLLQQSSYEVKAAMNFSSRLWNVYFRIKYSLDGNVSISFIVQKPQSIQCLAILSKHIYIYILHLQLIW